MTKRSFFDRPSGLTIAEIIAFAWKLKGKFPQGHGSEAVMVEKDVTNHGEDY